MGATEEGHGFFLSLPLTLSVPAFVRERKVDLSGDGVVRDARAFGLHQ